MRIHSSIYESAIIHESTLEDNVEIRQYSIVKNSQIGRGCKLLERVSVRRCQLGEEVFVNAGTYMEYVKVGNGVLIAPNCTIVGVTHKFSSKNIDPEDVFDLIKIGDGAWIGAGSVILPGVSIGEGSVIGANATVKIDIPNHHRYVGTPLQYRLAPISS